PPHSRRPLNLVNCPQWIKRYARPPNPRNGPRYNRFHSHGAAPMLSPLFRAAIVLTGCLAALGQSAPPSGTIAGTVLDGNTNTPIRRAIVTLSTVETQPQDAVAWSDANGRFAFGYLPPGGYELRVSKAGFQATAFGSEAPRRPPTVIQLAA